jgi:hypothetical protein
MYVCEPVEHRFRSRHPYKTSGSESKDTDANVNMCATLTLHSATCTRHLQC